MFTSFPVKWGRAKVTGNINMSSVESRALLISDLYCFCSDHEDYCLYNDTQSLIKRGESMIMPATCEEVSCGDDYTMQILG